MNPPAEDARDATLLELLDRLIDRGVVLKGDITISVADVDLIVIGLNLLLSSVKTAEQLWPENVLPQLGGGANE